MKSCPNLLLLAEICGDKCKEKYHGTCVCGDTSFNSDDALYCCTPKNESCVYQGMQS